MLYVEFKLHKAQQQLTLTTRARHQRAGSELGTGSWACVDCLPESCSIPSASAAFQSPEKERAEVARTIRLTGYSK